nr:PREDICTED: somatomedin-B and thrombospondin type-1 domain-containing protein-like [Bemisia tabaci]
MVSATNLVQVFGVVCLAVRSVYCGSCKEAKLCCPGRDSSCVVQKAPINAIIEDLSDKPCYCDHACLKLGDCCTDFKHACGGTDSSHWFSGCLPLAKPENIRKCDIVIRGAEC